MLTVWRTWLPTNAGFGDAARSTNFAGAGAAAETTSAIAIASHERFMPPPPFLAPEEARRDELPIGSDDP